MNDKINNQESKELIEKLSKSMKMTNMENKELIEKLKNIMESMKNKNVNQLTFSSFDDSFFTNSVDLKASEDITKSVSSKLTYIIRDIAEPKHNPLKLDLESIRSGTCLIAYYNVHPEVESTINLYYNKKIDQHTYNTITSVNDQNFAIIANAIHKHYTRFINGNQSNLDITLIEHFYDASKSVHLYTVPMEIIFHLELNSTPYPVCKYYTSFHENIISSDYEYANQSNIYTCSNKVLVKQHNFVRPGTPCPCPYSDKSVSQLSCSMYEPSSTFELSASSNTTVVNPIVTKVVLRSFKDRSTSGKVYTVSCDGNDSFKFACKDEEVEQIFNQVVNDLSVKGQSFNYSKEDIDQISIKKKTLSLLKSLFVTEKQNG